MPALADINADAEVIDLDQVDPTTPTALPDLATAEVEATHEWRLGWGILAQLDNFRWVYARHQQPEPLFPDDSLDPDQWVYVSSDFLRVLAEVTPTERRELDWDRPEVALDHAAEEAEELRQALAMALGYPDQCREDYTVPDLRRLAGLNPEEDQ